LDNTGKSKGQFVNFALLNVKKNHITEMEAILFLILIGVVVAGGFLIAFIWAVRSGQYDDDYSPSVRMLFDNKKKEETDTDISESNDK
jgi:cbb3-type cytochrome oxidase maturation protein